MSRKKRKNPRNIRKREKKKKRRTEERLEGRGGEVGFEQERILGCGGLVPVKRYYGERFFVG
jgi:hypothetical protein